MAQRTVSRRRPAVRQDPAGRSPVSRPWAALLWPSVLAAVFTATALIGVWAAYDRPGAWSRLALLVVGAAWAGAAPWIGRRAPASTLGWIALGCALLAAALAAYFLQAADWSAAGPAKVSVLQRAGLWVQAHRPALRLSEDINANVAAGGLVALIPIGLGGCAWAWRWGTPAGRLWAGAAGLASALACGALLLTTSRGAWVGLLAGGLTAALLAGSARRPGRGGVVVPAAWFLALAVAAGGIFWAALGVPAVERLLGGIGSVSGSALSRAQLWRDGLVLAGDAPFTGIGLGGTMMAYSTYAMLLHVGYITHAHNLFLQIALDQGLPGLAAFVALLALAGWALVRVGRPVAGAADSGLDRALDSRLLPVSNHARPASAPAEASSPSGSGTAGIPGPEPTPQAPGILSGAPQQFAGRSRSIRPSTSVGQVMPTSAQGASAFDRIENIEGGILSGAPQQFAGRSRRMGSDCLRLGAAAALVAVVVHGTVDAGLWASRAALLAFVPLGCALLLGAHAAPPAVAARPRSRRSLPPELAGAWLLVVIVALALLPGTRAAFQANLGAVQQARAELSVYRWPEWGIQDALRRSPQVDLAGALARYGAALALDPHNVAANRRLGQIELSRGEETPARAHLEAAFAAAPEQRPTRQLLGESYAIAGDVARAAALWRTIDLGQGQIPARQWWYEHLGRPAAAALLGEAFAGRQVSDQ